MPHKTQHHSKKHLTLQTTLVLLLTSYGLNLYWQTYGITNFTAATGLLGVITTLLFFAIPTLKYRTEVIYATDYEDTEDAFQEIININDPFYKEKIQTNNAHFKELTETKIEAQKPFFYSKFGVELQIEKENSVENKTIKYNIKVNQEKVMEGSVTIYEEENKIYIKEQEESLRPMPVLGTMLSESKTVKMFERTAKRKNYTIQNISFKPRLRTTQQS